MLATWGEGREADRRGREEGGRKVLVWSSDEREEKGDGEGGRNASEGARLEGRREGWRDGESSDLASQPLYRVFRLESLTAD